MLRGAGMISRAIAGGAEEAGDFAPRRHVAGGRLSRLFSARLWCVSRMLRRRRAESRALRRAAGGGPLLLFAMIVRLYSATTTRDYFSWRCWRSRPCWPRRSSRWTRFFSPFSLCFWLLHLDIRRHGDAARAQGAATRRSSPASRAAKRCTTRWASLRAGIAVGRWLIGARDLFLILPRVQRRLPVRLQHAAIADFRLQRRRRTRAKSAKSRRAARW